MNAVAQKIYRAILQNIQSGVYPPGSQLPFENDLAAKYKTSRMNVNRTMGKLAEEQVIVRIRHKGSFVTDHAAETVRLLLELKDRRAVFLHSPHPTHIHWNDATLASFQQYASAADYQVLYETIPADGGRNALSKLMTQLARLRPSGLVMFLDNYEYPYIENNSDLLDLFQCPVISLNRTGCPIGIKNITTLDLDHYGDGIQAAELLIANQCRKVLFYYSELVRSTTWFRQRRDGLMKTLEFAGIQAEFFEKGLHEESKVGWFVEKNGPESMIVAINNAHAAEVIRLLSNYRKKLGTDYRLLTFDYYPSACPWSLTSFVIDTERLGSLAAKLICTKHRNNLLIANCSVRIKSLLMRGDSFPFKVLPKDLHLKK